MDLRSGGMGGGNLEYRTYDRPADWQPRILNSNIQGVLAEPTIVKLQPGQHETIGDLVIENIDGHFVYERRDQAGNLIEMVSFNSEELSVAGLSPTDANVIFQLAE